MGELKNFDYEFRNNEKNDDWKKILEDNPAVIVQTIINLSRLTSTD